MNPPSIEYLLGGRRVMGRGIESDFDLYELSRAGIPKRSLVHLAAEMKLSIRSIARILHVAERTLQRKNNGDLLGEEISEHIIQIAEVYSRGTEVMDGADQFRVWLHSPNTAFGNRTPIELLSSRYGATMVLNELGRIEHGIVA